MTAPLPGVAPADGRTAAAASEEEGVPSGFRVRGQIPAALVVAGIVRSRRAHALLLVGPSGVGKTTLALDVAALLLCTAEPEERPCRHCRGCRMVASGNHPDVHRLAPEGPGGQIRIGSRSEAEPGTVRRLIADLAFLPVEGGERVAIVEHADRLNEDAQSALLKTLEEPPARTWLVLCADEEERLLPTVRSRCARVRLGPVAVREIEALLGELGEVDAPTANRLGRLAGGRPGVALGWAQAPDAVTARGEIARTLLDLLGAGRAARLTAIRRLLALAAEAASALATEPATGSGGAPGRGRRGKARGGAASEADPAGGPAAGAEAEEAAAAGPRRIPPAERRRAANVLIDVWRDVTRDLALVALGEPRRLRDPALLEDLQAAAAGIAPGEAGGFLTRLDRAGELIESNVNPELVADGLVLGWPRARG